jgi:hypothetical protein
LFLKFFVIEVITEYQATTGHNDNDAENLYEQIDEQCTARGAYIDMQGIKTDKDTNCEYIDMTIQNLSDDKNMDTNQIVLYKT